MAGLSSNAHDNVGLLPHANVCKQGHSCLYAWPFAGTSVSSAGGLSTCIRRVSVQAMLPYLTSRHLGYVRAGLMPPFWGRGRREGRSEGGGGGDGEIVVCIHHSSFGKCQNISRHGSCLSVLGRQHQDRVLLNFLTMNVAGTGCDWVIHVSYGRSARRWGRSRLRCWLEMVKTESL
jgi:hypothetical protein